MVIDVAVIASAAHLDDLAASGSIDMALTHLALRYPGYAMHHAARAAAGVTVMLDNSAYEMQDTLGSGLDAGPVLTAARLTDAAEVVCTDVPYDCPATLAATRRFLAWAAETADGLRFMAVPQGSTQAEWLACYDALTAMPGVHSIGISKLSVPRCWNDTIAAARLACVAQLHQHGTPPKPLHLLGGDGCLPAELRAHRERGHAGVRSSDSSAAFWYARLGIPLNPSSTVMAQPAPPRPDLETTRLTPAQLAAARAGITMIRVAAGLPAGPPEGATHDARRHA
jgi:hypothetical protein